MTYTTKKEAAAAFLEHHGRRRAFYVFEQKPGSWAYFAASSSSRHTDAALMIFGDIGGAVAVTTWFAPGEMDAANEYMAQHPNEGLAVENADGIFLALLTDGGL